MIDPTRLTFALPGDITTLTGGYVYDRRLVEGLRAQGRQVDVLSLSDAFPTPDADQMAQAMDRLEALPPDRPVIIDGLAFGAMQPDRVARLRAPILAMIHHPLAQESALPDDLARHLWRTERANLAHARHVVVPSPHTRAMLVERYDVPAHRISIARPGTDRPADPPRREPCDPPLILSVGILHPRKGHDVLIDALARIAQQDWQAVIVGNPWDADHVAALTARIRDAGLGDRIRLAGRAPAEELAQLYRQASVFALATRYEGYGIVFDEALLHGLPIVSTRAGAVPDTVPRDAGILVPPDDAPAFARALSGLLGDPQDLRARSEAAARAGASLPGWDATAAVVGDLLDAMG